jgi:hypothetical protein
MSGKDRVLCQEEIIACQFVRFSFWLFKKSVSIEGYATKND